MNTSLTATPVLSSENVSGQNSSHTTIVPSLATASSNTAASHGHSILTSLYSSYEAFTETTAPSEADIVDFFHTVNSILEVPEPLHFGDLQSVPSDAEYMEWGGSRPAHDPQDTLAKNAIFADPEHECFRSPFHSRRKILPREVELRAVPPDSVPYPLREIRCLEVRLRAVLPRMIGTGTFIPAGVGYGRAMVLAPFHQEGTIHYILCLHGNCEVFLIRAHEYCMDTDWSSWEQLSATYGQGNFAALFSARMDTLAQRIEGVRRQRNWFWWKLRGMVPPKCSWWTQVWSTIH